ncbi:lipase 5 [Aspergillus udagawae]|uniref:Lipase 5 n=1 Tax=Aspergillus udagawae TaxID=91492 RepID=A0A8H3S4W1_9EURO|nr:lipase 5 [Aspergillus udagawae]
MRDPVWSPMLKLSETLIEPTNSAISTPGSDRHSVDDDSSNQQGAGSDKPNPPNPSVPLQRSVYILFLTLLYGAAALYAWIIICILTYRPIGANSYGPSELDRILSGSHLGTTTVPEYLGALFAKSERYLKAARTVQSLVSVLTIPLTSAVCSQAAVAYIQRKRGAQRPTLRQSMALADKGWTDLVLLKNLVFGGWNKYRSSLLLFALFLHVLDFTDLFPDRGPDIGLDATKLRATLASTVNTVVQPRLWPTANGTVSLGDKSYYTYSALQTKSQNTLANISTITDPFWAELPTNTNTGLLQQFAPRIKSTPIWENNSAAVLPEDCKSSSDAFYLHYKYGQDNEAPFQYDIEICILGNMSQSPWKNQLSRQDFSEELYFQMNFSGDGGMLNYVPRLGTQSRKLTLHTTTDYFELPNYANGQVPGPLIEESPFGRSPRNFTPRDLANDTAWTTVDATLNMINVNNKGPLLYIAMALFGEGSFADVRHTVLAAYANSGISYGGCIDTIPFIPLLDDPHSSFKSSPGNPCLTGSGLTGNATRDRVYNDDRMHAIVAGYFFLFSGDPTYGPTSERVQNAFASAAFLANDMFMTNNYHEQSIDVSYDMGADVQIPHISRAGIIFVSTGTLDSFAMLRIGASISERVPLLAAQDVGRIKILDETPEWMGNASDGEIGELCLGGQRPLEKTRRYRCYDTDHAAQAIATRKPSGLIRRESYCLASGENT